jgi:peroxiredoxin
LPHLNALYRRYRSDGLVVLGLNADPRPEAARRVAAREIQFPCLFEAGGVSAEYEVLAYPTAVLLDREGRVRAQLSRAHPPGALDALEQQLAALIAEGKADIARGNASP